MQDARARSGCEVGQKVSRAGENLIHEVFTPMREVRNLVDEVQKLEHEGCTCLTRVSSS